MFPPSEQWDLALQNLGIEDLVLLLRAVVGEIRRRLVTGQVRERPPPWRDPAEGPPNRVRRTREQN